MNDHEHDRHPSPDLDRVLAGVPTDEAAGLRQVWDLSGREASDAFPDAAEIERVWDALAAHAAAPKGSALRHVAPRGPARRPVRRLRPWMAVAATLLLGLAMGLSWWLLPVVQTASPGQRLAVTLPDGSRVELNSGTSLRYPRRFGATRAVHLDGEAFFDVDAETRPFVVHTYNADVTVLGTLFNVRSWRRSMAPGTTVTLTEGRVALAPLGRPTDAVELLPGQTHRIAAGARMPAPPDTSAVVHALAWRTGDLVFKDQWLGVILEDVERRFDVAVTLQPVTLRQRRLTLASRNPGRAETVLRDISVALGLHYRETAHGWEIYGATSP